MSIGVALNFGPGTSAVAAGCPRSRLLAGRSGSICLPDAFDASRVMKGCKTVESNLATY